MPYKDIEKRRALQTIIDILKGGGGIYGN